jgi:predicted solute-binding protein
MPHHDLGRLWLERTGLPMVFAVWAAREPVVDGLAELQEALVASVRLARSEPEVLAHEASARYGYPPGFLARYFEKLRYSFGPRERAGLYTFLEMARDVGELAQVPELRFLQDGVPAIDASLPSGAGQSAVPPALDTLGASREHETA